MEFCKVMEEYQRMCDTFCCEDCPLNKEAEKLNEIMIEHYDCDGVVKYYPQRVEKIIEQWSRENPAPPPPIYPTIGEVIDKLLILMNISQDTPILAIYGKRLTKEAADYFGIAPISENILKSKT